MSGNASLAVEYVIFSGYRSVWGCSGIYFLREGRGGQNPLSHALRRARFPLLSPAVTSAPHFVTCGDISPRSGENLSPTGGNLSPWGKGFTGDRQLCRTAKKLSPRESCRANARLRGYYTSFCPLSFDHQRKTAKIPLLSRLCLPEREGYFAFTARRQGPDRRCPAAPPDGCGFPRRIRSRWCPPRPEAARGSPYPRRKPWALPLRRAATAARHCPR